MLTDQYKIRYDKGEYDHYEYMIDRSSAEADLNVSPSMFGIAMVEEHVSKILGEQVCFFYFQESRFFPLSANIEKDNMTLDVSLLGIGADNYSIIAEITYAGKILMEIAGKIRAI